MATSPASQRTVRAASATPGSAPPPAPVAAPAILSLQANLPIEKMVTVARQEELVALAESGSIADAIRLAIQEALQGAASGEPVLAKGDIKTPADIARANNLAATKSKAVAAAMAKHFRDKINDSPVSMGPAITEMKMSLQYMRALTPLMSAVIHNSSAPASVDEKRDQVMFLQNTAAELSKDMADAVTQQTDYNQFEQRELNLHMTGIMSRIWENTPDGVGAQEKMVDFVTLARAVYADKSFAQRHKTMAEGLLVQNSYLKVDCPEDMTARLSQSLHLAGLKFLEATGHARVMAPNGIPYSYKKERSDVVGMMMKTFDGVMAKLTRQHEFVSSLSNDMRTSTLQAWMRVASTLMADEYVQQTAGYKNELMRLAKSDLVACGKRFVELNTRLPNVIEQAGAKAVKSLQDLISQSIGQTARVRGEYYTDIQLASEKKAQQERAALDTEPADHESAEPASAPR